MEKQQKQHLAIFNHPPFLDLILERRKSLEGRFSKPLCADGNIVFYAQHAVAACCRNCIEVWHGIATQAAGQSELDFFRNFC